VRIPSLMNARYRSSGPAHVPSYLQVEDIIQQKSHLGKWLPKTDQRRKVLAFWMRHPHPAFAAIIRFLDWDGQYLAILPSLHEFLPLSQWTPQKLKNSAVSRVFLNLVSGCRWLNNHQLSHPQFNLNSILISEEGRVQILGHEASFGFENWMVDGVISHLDIRYAAPEIIAHQIPTEKSLVFHLAAVFYHFLMGVPYQRGETYFGIRSSNRKLKKGWDALLGEMLKTDPSDRPNWETVWQRVCEDLLDDPTLIHSACPEWHPENSGSRSNPLENFLAQTDEGPFAVCLMTVSGGSAKNRLNPFTRIAEKKGYLVVHTWRDEPVQRAYQTINEVISLVKLGFLEHIDRPDLEEAFLPLSEWQSADDLKRRWRQTLAHLINSMVPRLYRGIVLVLEDFHHIDPVSLETLITFTGWMAPTPFLLLLTGPSQAHPHFRQFFENWQHSKTTLQLSTPNANQVTQWFIKNGRPDIDQKEIAKALRLIGGKEIYFQLWLRDQDPKGEVWQWLNRVWSWLKPKEQLILKMLSCSIRPLSVPEMEAAFGLTQLGKHIGNLEQFDLVIETSKGHALSAPIWAHWVKAELTSIDQRHSLSRLLDFEKSREQPDPVQVVHLAEALGEEELLEKTLQPVIEEFLDSWDTEILWRLESLYLQDGRPRFKEFYYLAARTRWKPEPLGELELEYPFFKMMEKAQKKILQGNFTEARKQLAEILGKRKTPSGLKAWCLTWLVECASFQNDALAVGKGWRHWIALDKTSVNKDWVDMFTARMAACMYKMESYARSLDMAVAGLPDYLRAWIQAQRSWELGLFEDATAAMEGVLKEVPRDAEPIWLGRVHQLRGNLMYRQYRPAEAIRCYEEARNYFEMADFAPGISDISFNLASAEKLAGRFVSSITRFEPLLKEAEAQDDKRSQAQIIFNLMVCALYQNDLKLFDRWAAIHERLTSNRADPAETVRRLAVWLQTALLRSKDEIFEVLSQMEVLLKHAQLDSVTVNEVHFSQRWGQFALGRDSFPPARPYPEMTRWRHKLIDTLTGLEGVEFSNLAQTIGRGFLGACHFFLLSTVIIRKLLPEEKLDQSLLRAYQNHAQISGAQYGQFLKTNFSHLRGLGDVPPEAWRRALHVLSEIDWGQKKPETLEEALLTALHAVWAFSDRGSCRYWRNRWGPSELVSSNQNQATADLLNLLQVQTNLEPFITQFASPESNDVRSVLFLPVGSDGNNSVMLWFMASTRQGYVGVGFDLLFRFYAKLFEWVFHQRRTEKVQIVPAAPVKRGAFGQAQRWEMVGESGRMQEIKDKILQFSPSNLNIFVFGESGTGKELAASAIHQSSRRQNKPFRAVNCAHYPENLVEAHLFGHARGAYTGATLERAGLLEQVDGGTLFLDEIGDINAKVQSLLLRVIQEGEFSRIGETKVRKVDIRFITATNKNLHQLIDYGQFREDLFFRLVEFELSLPALFERFEDLPLLISHFVKKHHPQLSPSFDKSFYDHLRSYRWPGNVRELESYIRKLLVQWPDQEIFTAQNALPFLREKPLEIAQDSTLEAHINHCRRHFISARLQQFGWNKTRSAESLGISRQQLANLISKYKLGQK